MSDRPANPLLAHVVPFVAWIAVLHFLDVPQLKPSWQYAVRAAVGALLLVIYQPGRWYPRLHAYNLPLALIVGVGVFLIWVLPESPLAPAWLREPYLRWAVRPWGEFRNPIEAAPYAPSVCGWPLTLIRLFGSGLIIPIIEEFFWRGFMARWVMGGDFWRHDAGQIDFTRFLMVAAVFGIEHQEWLAGFLAGLAYGWMYMRTRDIWAVCLAHAVTNLLLGFYVIRTGAWQFW